MPRKLSKKKQSRFKKNKFKFKEIATQRISHLNEAESNYSKHPERSHRYAELANNLKLKYNVKLTPEVKRRLCKKCNKFMVPGKNCRIRIHNSRLIYTCTECSAVRRFGLK